MNIQEIRAQYPQYADMSDEQIARGLHKKHYADMPFDEFSLKLNVGAKPEGQIIQRQTELYGKGPDYSATEGIPAMQLGLEGVGQALNQLELGARDIMATASMDPERQAAMDAEIARTREIDAPLLDTTAGTLGNVAGNIAVMAPAAMTPGAATIPGSAVMGGLMGSLLPTTGEESRLENIGMGVGLGAGGQVAGKYAAGALASNKAALAQEAIENAPIDAAIASAREAGYVLPPTQANPTMTNRLLEGLSGKIMTEKQAALKNQNITNALARQDLGIEEISPSALTEIRQEAGKIYEEIGSALPEYQVDDAFLNDVSRITKTITDLGDEYQSFQNPQVNALIDDVLRDKFDGKQMMEVIKQLRADSNTNFKSFDDPKKRSLAFAQRGIADSMEDLMDRNLEKNGMGEMMSAFKEARRTIAKTHTYDKALNEATGNIQAPVLAKEFAKGKPLSGEAETIARASATLPKVTREITDAVNPITLPTLGFGGLGAATNSPSMIMMAASRPAVRAGILSDAFQRNVMGAKGYQPGILPRIAEEALEKQAATILPLTGLMSLGNSRGE